jgi:hypothetical protein
MNIRELIELLEEAADQVGNGAEIQLATQPAWPLRYHLAGVYVPEDDGDPAEDAVVWLVEGGQHYENPYGVPEHAWDAAVRP